MEIVISLASLLLLSFSVIYAAIQIKMLRKQHQDNHDWKRRITAQETINKVINIQSQIETLTEKFDYHNKREGIFQEVFEQEFKKDKLTQSRLHIVLNFYESIARGIRQGIYDELVIKNAVKGQMIRIYESFKYYISSRREYFKNDKIFIELEQIINKWRNEDLKK